MVPKPLASVERPPRDPTIEPGDDRRPPGDRRRRLWRPAVTRSSSALSPRPETFARRNEDNYYVPGLTHSDYKDTLRAASRHSAVSIASDDEPHLFLVADGMGGQLAGEKASEMAVS